MKHILNFLFFVCVVTSSATAGIFNTVHFVEPGKSAIGLEPELTLSEGAGLGINAKFTQGINDLINVAGILGTGGGPRQFRVGGDIVFDFFPDVDQQPGIGLLTRAIYYRIPDTGRFEVSGAPYLHKAFLQGGATKATHGGGNSGADEIDPFIAFPIGLAFTDGSYHATSQFVLGAMFKTWEQFRYSLELGVNLNYAETYVSGGITFYP